VSGKSDIDAEKAHLLRCDAEWALAASEGRDVERILSFWTDDAVVLPPDLPSIIGKAACVNMSRAVCKFPDFGSRGRLTRLSFRPTDSLLIW
jgi:ketosteroid isomerase-like protein